MLDLIIRNGRIVDGSGLPAYRADVGIAGGRIVKVGHVGEAARQTIEGDGSRYVRDSRGVDTVIVGGEVAWSQSGGYAADGRGAILPGRASDLPSATANGG